MKKIEMIEKYLDGTMSDSEKENFEKFLTQDEELASELIFHKELNEAILSNKSSRV